MAGIAPGLPLCKYMGSWAVAGDEKFGLAGGSIEILPCVGQECIVKSQILMVHGDVPASYKEGGSVILNVVTRVHELTPWATNHAHSGSQTT